MARAVPDDPLAFISSMEINVKGRATQDAVAEM
jgi:hypothetical protein